MHLHAGRPIHVFWDTATGLNLTAVWLHVLDALNSCGGTDSLLHAYMDRHSYMNEVLACSL